MRGPPVSPSQANGCGGPGTAPRGCKRSRGARSPRPGRRTARRARAVAGHHRPGRGPGSSPRKAGRCEIGRKGHLESQGHHPNKVPTQPCRDPTRLDTEPGHAPAHHIGLDRHRQPRHRGGTAAVASQPRRCGSLVGGVRVARPRTAVPRRCASGAGRTRVSSPLRPLGVAKADLSERR